MKECARGLEAPLIPERKLHSVPSTIGDGLLKPSHSAHISRNGHLPPKAPHSSAKLAFSPDHSGKNSLGRSKSSIKPNKFRAAEAITKLACLETREQNMVVGSFDGPAGQMEDSNTAGLRRHPSQPEIINDGSSGLARKELPVTSGLNLLTVGGANGRDYRSPLTPTTMSKSNPQRRATSLSSKPAHSSRGPRYSLKTIPPKSPDPAGNHLRPGPQHVPGSYRSEVIPTPASSVGESTPVPDNRPASGDQGSPGDPSYFVLGPGTPSSAVECLKHATTPSASRPISQMRDMHSSESLTDQAREAQPAEAFLTLGTDHEHLYGVGQAASSPVFETDHKSEEEGRLAQEDARPESSNDKAEDHAEETVPSFNGPHVSELLSQLPPIAQITLDDQSGHRLTAKPSIQSGFSVHGAMGKHSNLLPATTESVSSSRNDHLGGHSSKIEIHQHRNMDLLSNVSQKLSSVGKSLSTLSEISLKSDPKVPSSSSSRKHEKIDPVNGGPRTHWMRQVLAKASGSSISIEPSNLTPRPAHRQRHVLEAAERQGATSIPTCQLPTASTDEEIIAQQQQENADSFARVIVDLESLLKEALVIAHQAAGKDHSDDGHALGQASYNTSRYTLEGSDGLSAASGGQDEEDNHTTFPQQLSLKASMFHDSKLKKERGDMKNNLLENSRPQALDSMCETQVHPLQGGFEPSKTIVQDMLPAKRSQDFLNSYSSHDWAIRPVKQGTEESETLSIPRKPIALQTPTQEQRRSLVRARKESPSVASGETVHHHINARQAPPIQPRVGSLGLRAQARRKETHPPKIGEVWSSGEDASDNPSISDSYYPERQHDVAPRGRVSNEPQSRSGHAPGQRPPRHDTIMSLPDINNHQEDSRQQDERSTGDNMSLTNRHHFSIREPKGFSLSRSHRRAPIARDWSTRRKRYVATVACINTALMGLIIGIYAGEVPAIQYAMVDEHHFTILGNVVLFIGLAITTALFWPLPLLHGRKPYILAALAILLPLQFPQAVAVGTQRSTNVGAYRVGLLLPRAISGLIMGFANINFKSTLLDLFGASLQSVHPHQEFVNVNDVRRHGGGMGVWLGIWTWCHIGSLGVGFLIGAVIISGLSVTWGFWITIMLMAAILVLNVLSPEVRRSAYRRSMAEVRSGADVSRRVARGEVKMHLQATGPIWWWEEVWAGHVLCIRMLKQPGFVVLSLYLGWIYGQVVMVIVVCHSSIYI